MTPRETRWFIAIYMVLGIGAVIGLVVALGGYGEAF